MTYRHPGILVKTVSTLDVLSEGGAPGWASVPAGTSESTWRSAFPFRNRGTLRATRGDAANCPANVVCERYAVQREALPLAETLNQPMPIAKPRPRIMIGGAGEQKTLRLVARYADACNLFARPGDEGLALLAHKLDVLREHCEVEGRPYESIEKTVIGPTALREPHPMAIEPEALPDFLAQLEDMGIDHYICGVIDRGSLDVLLEEVLPRSTRVEA